MALLAHALLLASVSLRLVLANAAGAASEPGAISSHRKNITIFQDANAISGRVDSPRTSSPQVVYLGDQETLSACEQECVSRPECHGFTWHSTKFDPVWAKGCYGILDWTWNAPQQNKVISGQVGDWPKAGECASDDLCNYNGKCVNKKCVCSPQWKGDACDVLNLLPSSSSLGYQGVSSSGNRVTSWGGSVVVGDDSLYHMYASEITGNCGMNVWLSNSQVIHATSPDPTTTPFKKVGVVQGMFAHEPIAARAPTGEYVVYFTAVLAPNPLPVQGGNTCTGCSNGRSVASCGTDDMRNASVNLPTYMVYSKNPDGPWSEPAMVPGTDVFADSNFAPVINEDGTLIALERGNVVRASNWRDVSTYKVAGKYADAGEDPFVWRDAAGIYHNIVHVQRIHTYGLHYFSVDGISWTASPGDGHAYEYSIAYEDGSHEDLACRERPHIVQNVNGDIIALTNGAAPIACHDASKDDYSFTSLQVVGQHRGGATASVVV